MRTTLLLAAALLASPSLVEAQRPAPSFGVEGAGLYATVDGDDFEGTKAGMGLDVQARVRFSSFSIGAGFQRSSHDIDEVSDNIIVSGFFVEPRLGFPASASFSPFITGRVGRVTQKIETDIPDFGSVEAESRGFLFGAGGGLEFTVAPAVRLNLSALYSRLSFGDVDVDGEEVPDSDSSGSSVMLRAGVSFSFGSR